jgi:ADP-ribose pyrophosphatase
MKTMPQEGPWKHGPWEILQRETIYQDPWLEVRVDQVTRPDGFPGTYSNVLLRAGVCVLAIDATGQLHLTREFHYAVGRITVEGVSGGIEDGETAEFSAHRELFEELGIKAGQLDYICTVDPFTASVASPTQIFFATDLTFHEPQNEGTEQIEHVTLAIDDALRMVEESQITHGPTCVAILRYALQITREAS